MEVDHQVMEVAAEFKEMVDMASEGWYERIAENCWGEEENKGLDMIITIEVQI